MQRYFLEEAIDDRKIKIRGDDAKHISRVMRMEPGDAVICCGPDGRCAKCSLEKVATEEVTASVVEFLREKAELPVSVTVAQGLPKKDKLELIVQKGTELGADRFLPFQAERSIVKWDRKKSDKKRERLRKIAKEAAEQSHRSRIPEVESPVAFQDLLSAVGVYDVKILAYEEEAKAGEASRFARLLGDMKPGQSLIVIIGPEGGLSKREVDLLEKQGCVSCGLGPRILRTETAALYTLSAVSYQFE
ncbi:MAG TPA: 16S rRNA (uracil(1498)-N(3))-methyltransferase, partial [Bacillales bacterium]|nr:16S rRNA (uracil(1498)-N(3))-methyltransferase [Bacillales bacterium]